MQWPGQASNCWHTCPTTPLSRGMTGTQRAAIAALEEVQWTGIFQPAYRIAPCIPVQASGEATLVVLTFPSVDMVTIIEELVSMGECSERRRTNLEALCASRST